MDFLASHNLARTQLLQVGDATTWIRWYPALPTAKAFPGWHCTGHPIWQDMLPTPIVGPHCHKFPRIWRGKRYPAAPGQHFHGPLEWFAEGIPPDQLGIGDPDRRCGVPVAEALGGGVAGGAAVVALDLLLPQAWAASRPFGDFLLSRSSHLVLGLVADETTVVGPE
ncbi:MAG: hypothetical protein HC834_07020, partial [Rhodospirillales bacterium]|nr:hypothetical protein [Rhodospirillales bacterium]